MFTLTGYNEIYKSVVAQAAGATTLRVYINDPALTGEDGLVGGEATEPSSPVFPDAERFWATHSGLTSWSAAMAREAIKLNVSASLHKRYVVHIINRQNTLGKSVVLNFLTPDSSYLLESLILPKSFLALSQEANVAHGTREFEQSPDAEPTVELSSEEQAELTRLFDAVESALDRVIQKSDRGLALLQSNVRELQEAREVLSGSNRRSESRMGATKTT